MTGKNNIDATPSKMCSTSPSPLSSSTSSFPVTRCPTAYAEGGETPQGPDLPEPDRAFLAARREASEAARKQAATRHRPSISTALRLYWAERRYAKRLEAANGNTVC